MPIGTPHGTLDYKQVSKVTFVGASSNTVIDTTTGSLGVGVDGNGPTSNLHVVGDAFVSSNLTVSGFVGTSETGALTVPYGTTAQQPTGVSGMIRFNTTTNKLEVYNGTQWQSLGGVNAIGGTITSADGYTIHTFTSASGTFTVLSGGEVEYLVVAGGGGGGAGVAGGGGAGGMLTGNMTLTPDQYTITIGGGGVGGIRGNTWRGTNGSDSSIASLVVAIGGGAGSSAQQGGPGFSALSGGSGGGGSWYSDSTGITGAGGGTIGQGNNGGNGVTNYESGAGGGGSNSAGSNAVANNTAGNGGDGLESSISGTSTRYAGGGGGGANGTPGTGGLGGGGDGGNLNNNGVNGTENTGGGGGGGWAYASGNGGSGGSGIVIIRYLS